MRIFHGIEQKKQNRMLFNSICGMNCVNPQQVREDMKAQNYEDFTPSGVTKFINQNY